MRRPARRQPRPAFIGLLVYTIAQGSAAVGMAVRDYDPQGRRMWPKLDVEPTSEL